MPYRKTNSGHTALRALPALAEATTSFVIPRRTDLVPEVNGTQDFLIPKSLERDTMMKAGTRVKWNNHSFFPPPGLYRPANKKGHMPLY